MQISPNSYLNAIQSLKTFVTPERNTQSQSPYQFPQAAVMPYANLGSIPEKAHALLAAISKHLESVPQEADLFFTPGDTVPIPDLHGDFVHLMLILHRHGLLEGGVPEPHLRKEFQYVLLGDIYNRGKDADVIDFWLNKQIERGVEIYRLLGNHELFFVMRRYDGNPLCMLPIKDVPFNDTERDMANDFRVTESLLKNIKDGKLLASYVSFKNENGNEASVPELYAHTYVTSNLLEGLGLLGQDITQGTASVNETLKKLGADSYERFMDCKVKGRYNWPDISEPFFSSSLFNIQSKNAKGMHDSYTMRITGLSKNRGKISARLPDKIPSGIYQIVGHTRVASFDVPEGFPKDRPMIFPSKDGDAFVQFSDVGIGQDFSEDSFERPRVIINKRLAQLVKQ